jgi:hypothetical protein
MSVRGEQLGCQFADVLVIVDDDRGDGSKLGEHLYAFSGAPPAPPSHVRAASVPGGQVVAADLNRFR